MITVLITSHNRPKALLRLLLYYQTFKKKLSIIVLDSSEKNILEENFNLKNIFRKNSQFKLIKFKKDKHICEKIILVLDLIKSKHVTICGDDDFILYEELNKCIFFLNNNKDYITCLGKTYSYTCFQKPYTGFSIQENSIHSRSVTNNKKNVRISDFLKGRGPVPFYGVFRTSDFIMIWKIVYRISKDVYFSEFTHSLLTYYFGKIKKFKSIYAIRHPNENFIPIEKKILKKIFSTTATNRLLNFFNKKIDIKNTEIIKNYIKEEVKILSTQKENNKNKNLFIISPVKFFLRPLKNFIQWQWILFSNRKNNSLKIIKKFVTEYPIFSSVLESRKNFYKKKEKS